MPSRERYPWKRFWCPPDRSCDLSDGGFLWDPDEEFGSALQPDLVSFDTIAEIPCLVLIGEPGIGKTFVLEDLVRDRKATLAASGGHVCARDLGGYNTDVGIRDAVFGSREVRDWAESDYILEMYLDSLDECLVDMTGAAKLLTEQLNQLGEDSLPNLRLRLVCRTGAWRSVAFLEQDFERLWGQGRTAVYELVPLRRKDVALAARRKLSDPEGFMREVAHKAAVPFAIKPVTLETLLDEYEATGEIPSTQLELYRRGCLRLCAARGFRRHRERHEALTPEQRFAVAERIAALTLFGKRIAISSDLDDAVSWAQGLLTVSRLGGEPPESVSDTSLTVDAHAIEEVLRTGLFTSRGGRLLGWGHKSYEEFLAAMWLVHHHLTPDQIGDLIFRPPCAGEPLEVIPQLRDMVVWLAVASPEVMHRVATVDPRSLLRKPMADADEKSRARLTGFLLELTESGRILIHDLDLDDRLDVLNHSGLQDQLTPWIKDRNRSAEARCLAIEIGGACKLKGLGGLIANVALSDEEPLPVRVAATRAAGKIGSQDVLPQLRKLLRPDPADERDQLKGYALQILWPEHITAKELFSALTPQKRGNCTGPYQRFLDPGLMRDLGVPDIPVALEWARQQGPDRSLSLRIRELVHAIVTLAFCHLDDEVVLDAFVQAALVRISHRDRVLGNEEDAPSFAVLSEGRRRRVARALVSGLTGEKGASHALLSSCPGLLTSEDLPWLLKELLATTDAGVQRLLTKLVSLLWNRFDTAQVMAVLASTKESAILREEFKAEFEPVRLDSSEAAQARRLLREYEEFSVRREAKPPTHPPLRELVETGLRAFEAGDTDAWWRLNHDMALMLDNDAYPIDPEFAPDITALPGWQASDEQFRARIVRAAKEYLMRGDPETDRWLGQDVVQRHPSLAGYRAIALLFRVAPTALQELPNVIWSKWAPAVISFPEYPSQAEDDVASQLIEKVYDHAPAEVIGAMNALIDVEDRKYGCVSVLGKLVRCSDRRLAEELLRRLQTDCSLKGGSLFDVLVEVLRRGNGDAIKVGRSYVTIPAPSEGEERNRARAAATALLVRGGQAGFDAVWTDLQGDPAFLEEVITLVTGLRDQTFSAQMAGLLNARSIAELYIWIARRWPPSEYSAVTGAGLGQDVAFFRDALLNQLCERGTTEAYEGVRKIAEEFAREDYRNAVHRARARTMSSTWEGVAPEIMLSLAKQHDSRLVESGEQLLDVVMASLARFQAGLRGDSRAVYNLWNEPKEGHTPVYRPKDEPRLSDRVQEHLKNDLRDSQIVPNREVQMSRGLTDIKVNAVACDGTALSLAIETKGCWNDELHTAMQTQLLDKYLRGQRPAYGMYLVGWFLCDKWDPEDPKRRKPRRFTTLDEARGFLENQANDLSGSDVTLRAFVLDATIP
ncbi:MAG: hypothetical protein JW889_16640 [Verrucomicrobia bacterium]|nr:hypothetical protein [Verrucomicrobiota bacterium]